MKRLTTTQAFFVLQRSKELLGDFRVCQKEEGCLVAYDAIPVSYNEQKELQGMIKEMLGLERSQLKPYFSKQWAGFPVYGDQVYFEFRALLEDIYDDPWYRDDDCLVQGDQTITRFVKGKTYKQMINEVQALLVAQLDLK